MGAVAVGQQLNTSRQSRKSRTPEPPKQYKDTTRTRYNAIRHGILARSVVLPGEDRQQYEDLRTALSLDLQTVGMVEEMWLDQLASCYWRLQRIHRAEAEPDAKLDLLHRYEVSLRNESKGLIAEIHAAQRRRHERYFQASARPDKHRESIQTAARDEARFWDTVQQFLDDPTPTPAPAPPRAAAPSRCTAPPPGAGVSPAIPRGAATPASMPSSVPPRGAAVPAAMPSLPPPRPSLADEAIADLPLDVPITDAAVRFAMESRQTRLLAPEPPPVPQVHAYVGDRLGLMSRNGEL